MLTHWSNLNRFLNDFTDLNARVDSMPHAPRARVHSRMAWAAADIGETEDLLTLTIDVPGLRSEDVEILVEDRVLRVQGSRPQPELEGTVSHRQERRFGDFSRSFRLGSSLDPSGTVAGVVDGVLTVTIPKSPESKPLRIEVA